MWVLTEDGELVNLAQAFDIKVDHYLLDEESGESKWSVVASEPSTMWTNSGFEVGRVAHLCWCSDEEHGTQIIARLAASIGRGAKLVVISDMMDAGSADAGVTSLPTHYQPIEVSREQALRAAREIADEGGPVTFASVARRSGLKYSQIVYAFGRVAHLREAIGESA